MTASVTIVFVVFNRRDELRESLRRMLVDSDYERDRVDVIVVDNASTDGSGAMVRDEFPEVQLIARDENIGASAWNDGFAIARGDYVLILDDDCYLPPDGLRRAVARAEEHDADLVSLSVASTIDPDHLFTAESPMGLMSFWGCAWLVRREVLDVLGGYDPEIFIWDNELEFTLRFFDRGYRHVHAPEIVAQHMKPPLSDEFDSRWYRANAHHFAYIAVKHLRARDAIGAVVAVFTRVLRDGVRRERASLRALPDVLAGTVHGLRFRQPVRNRELSRFYRQNFHGFASPWWMSRSAGELIRARGRKSTGAGGRRQMFFEKRARAYPEGAGTLQF
ncbi:MAG TPA: glycosyltransferase [Thermoleophilaceae bacterium]|nr:glycosyltransferase [Thermoleophilaceae bacterium]